MEKETGTFVEKNLKGPFIEKKLLRSCVNTLLADGKGHLWIGLEGTGLVRYTISDGSIHVTLKKDGLPSNYVYGLIADSKGRIWVGTNSGLACHYNHQTIVFSQKSGLLTESFETNCTYFNPHTNTIWMGATDYLLSFNPDQLLSVKRNFATVFSLTTYSSMVSCNLGWAPNRFN